MTIRCAELKIPAAIGCGEQLFNRAYEVKKKIEPRLLNKKYKIY